MLTVEDLTVSFYEGTHSKKIIENVSFSLSPGESLGIVGESGSGKTITALSILQLLPAGMKISSGNILLSLPENQSSDTVHLPWKNLALLSEKQMKANRGSIISMIFQEPMSSLNPSMRCNEQICETIKLHLQLSAEGVTQRLHSLLEEVHLPSDPGFYRKYPHQLSGGQRQRVMIAMALAGNPAILIADEPTTALDVTVQEKILRLLHEIRVKRQMSMLFISHDLGVIRSVCENALVMYKGKVVESGKVAELFIRPEHPYTRGLIACRPVPGSSPLRLPTLKDFMEPESEKEQKEAEKSPAAVNRPKVQELKPGEASAHIEPQALLEVRNLQVHYSLKKNLWGKTVKSLRAVNDISFRIDAGETLGLIGESGCGKSTLGRSLIRLIQSNEGDILYRGTSVSSLKGSRLIEFRRKVQFIFQDPFSSLNPRIMVGSAVMEVMRVHGIHKTRSERKQEALELFDKVGLEPGHFMRYPHEFSGGQRQRIGMARALATGPELIICDESVSSLDVSVQAMILNLLNDLKESLNLTYLFISHDLSVVRYMSDRIMVMKDGRMVEQAAGEEIFSNPSSDYTRELIASIPG